MTSAGSGGSIFQGDDGKRRHTESGRHKIKPGRTAFWCACSPSSPSYATLSGRACHTSAVAPIWLAKSSAADVRWYFALVCGVPLVPTAIVPQYEHRRDAKHAADKEGLMTGQKSRTLFARRSS